MTQVQTPIKIGIEPEDRRKIAAELSRLLADSYSLYLKCHNFHWNVTGPMFMSLHNMFEEQYTELAEAVDQIAERIRILGEKAPGTFREFLALTSVNSDDDAELSANQMVESLMQGHEQVVRTAKKVLSTLEGANDEGTAGLVGTRIETHEKAAWMLRSLLG